MQERNITLTLEKAKEWYEKGGELKEIALQAFKESELNPKRWIDLGLPSGTLWCDTNEEGYFSWNKMKKSFNEENLPKLIDFAELCDYCKWEWNNEEKGMDVIGPNGNCIFLPAAGWCNLDNNSLSFMNCIGKYRSNTFGTHNYSLDFDEHNEVEFLSDCKGFGFSVRLIKRK